MNTIHVANGDFAAQSLTQALKFSERDERVMALRDDLAVGPLRDIDDSSLARDVLASGAQQHVRCRRRTRRPAGAARATDARQRANRCLGMDKAPAIS